MAGLVGPMTMTVWFSAATVDGCDGAAAKITQLQHPHEDAGTLLFESGEGVRQRAPPILTYIYVRIISTKKENCRITPYGSPTLSDHDILAREFIVYDALFAECKRRLAR